MSADREPFRACVDSADRLNSLTHAMISERPVSTAPTEHRPPPGGLYAGGLKRGCDIALAVVFLILLLPVMAVVWLVVRIALGLPVFHRDLRAGRGGVPFEIVKFRSMTEAVDGTGEPLPDAARLTAIGRALRRSSLDELPQLFCVLSGRMSLVGPRPLPVRYTPRYDARQATRLLVRPGLTGWAQIHGRNAVDWPRRLELDARYVDQLDRWYAPFTDLWIILATAILMVGQSITGRGVSAPGSATMQEFAP